MSNDTDTVAVSLAIGREEDVGIDALLQLLDARAGIELPGPAEEIGIAKIALDTGTGIGAVTGTERNVERRAFAQVDDDRHLQRFLRRLFERTFCHFRPLHFLLYQQPIFCRCAALQFDTGR